nr:ShlB/FhaC/HecB family hemolysin secretion/activation protein [Desulfobulbaceae bacterium]
MKKNITSISTCALLTGVILLDSLLYVSFAATPSETAAAINEAERIQREQQLQLERDREKLQEKSQKDSRIEVQEPERKEVLSGGQTFIFHTIELQNATLLSEKEKGELTKKYLNKAIDFTEINNLLNDILAYYFLKGYISARVYIIPDQNISTGILSLKVMEGIVEEIRLENETSRVNLFTAFPFMQGRILNLRDLEQGIDQINRLTSNTASSKLLPGTKDGQSIIIIANEDKSPLSGAFSYNNNGSDSTGKGQVGLSANLDNPLRINDSLGVSINITEPLDDSFQETIPDVTGRYSRSALFNYSIPFGYSTFAVGASRSEYVTPINLADGTTAHSEGKSVNKYATFDWRMYRSQTDKLNLFTTLTNKRSDNYFMGSFISTSSRKLVVLDFGIDYSTVLHGGFASGKLTYSSGTKLLNAKQDSRSQDSSLPKSQFQTVKLNLSYVKPLEVTGVKSNYFANFSGQYSNDVLFGSEQISIGGSYSVRGFHTVSDSSDRGWYLQNTLTFTPDIMESKFGIKDCSVSPFIGYDVGQLLSHYSQENRWLSGAAVGIGMKYKKLSVNLNYSHPLLSSNRTFDMDSNKNGRVLLSTSLSF